MKSTGIYIVMTLIIFFVLLPMLNKKKKGDKKDDGDTVFIRRKQTPEEGTELKDIFGFVVDRYGKDIAKNTEKIYRLETAHFTSGQYRAGYSAGMTAKKKYFPFGWTSLKKFWEQSPEIAPTGTDKYNDFTYIKFPSPKAAIVSLAEVLKKRNNDAPSWYSTKAEEKNKYAAALDTIKNKFV